MALKDLLVIVDDRARPAVPLIRRAMPRPDRSPIVHATDFSREAVPAFRAAVSLAAAGRRRLSLVHVLMPPSPFVASGTPWASWKSSRRRPVARRAGISAGWCSRPGGAASGQREPCWTARRPRPSRAQPERRGPGCSSSAHTDGRASPASPWAAWPAGYCGSRPARS